MSFGIPKRTRDCGRVKHQRPFVPPEDWHEPNENTVDSYVIVEQAPGEGFRHIVTPDEVRHRLEALPSFMLAPLEVVQLSGLTRKKMRFPCYGMQWGPALYLYPVEETLEENYFRPPTPIQFNEARMYGGKWNQCGAAHWKLTWTEATLKDFYLNNILIHELGHLLDTRNRSYVARERYAEWFAIEYGYKPTRDNSPLTRPVRTRHHST